MWMRRATFSKSPGRACGYAGFVRLRIRAEPEQPTGRARRGPAGASRRGGCACGAIRYELAEDPLIVHACHCRDCQRLTGSAFVVNLWIERASVTTSGASPRSFALRAGSGRRHEVFFCGDCGTTLWSHYHVVPAALFVRAGTLDDPRGVTPDVHLFTRSKLPWVALPAGVPAFAAFYRIAAVWSPAQRARWRRARTAGSKRRATDLGERCPSRAASGQRASS
jgi:hypothetical protein